jgi:peptidoglycan-N-acetylglucosamine deacetylase
VNILTIDLEDWFHLLEYVPSSNVTTWDSYESRIFSSTDLILEILDEHKAEATFFVLGWIADRYPSLIERIHNAGHHIGSHSYAHKLVHTLTPKEFKQDLADSCYAISNVTNSKVDAYRAPGFSITDTATWAFEILAEHEIKFDASVFTAKRHHGGMSKFEMKEPSIISGNSFTLKEFPMNYVEFFKRKIILSGGGYLRLCPHILLQIYASKIDYNMVYLHPRDFDIAQPRLQDISLKRYIRSYIGLASTYRKFHTLSSMNSASIRQLDNYLKWENAGVYNV